MARTVRGDLRPGGGPLRRGGTPATDATTTTGDIPFPGGPLVRSSLRIARPGHHAASLTFPLLRSRRWEFVDSCADDHTPVPLGRFDVADTMRFRVDADQRESGFTYPCALDDSAVRLRR